MTLVLALRAQDGVVLASDGQATSASGVPTRTATEKLDVLHDRIAFGCAGSAGLRQRVALALQERIGPERCNEPFEALRDDLHEVVNGVQKHAESVYLQAKPYNKLHTLDVLFAGFSDNEPWIYEVSETADDQRHEIGESIGAGRHFDAYALNSAAHYELTTRGLGQVRLLAYRAVDDAIRTDASALGPPVQLVEVTNQEARRLDDDEVAAVKTAVNAWQGHECEIFDEQGAGILIPGPEEDGRGIEAPVG